MVNIEEKKFVSEKSYAYTPGLKVKRYTTVIKERKLPISGNILVGVGDDVTYDKVVAKTFVSGDPYIIRAALDLGVRTEELNKYMIKDLGDQIERGELLAEYSSFFGLINKNVESPVEGIIETISEVTGQVIIRTPPKPVTINAYIPGRIVEVFPREGVSIETKAALIQGIFGIGGEKHGRIKMIVDSPDDVITPDIIPDDGNGYVFVGGSHITMDALKKAVENGTESIIVGGIDYNDLKEFLGEEVGVAITGEEELGLTLIIMEGFGKLSISNRTFDLLKRFEGHMVCLNGKTQIRAGVIRPEIIIPHGEKFDTTIGDELSDGMFIGTTVRIIMQPYFGSIGRVIGLPIDLKKIDTQSHVRVVEVELDDCQKVVVPRANVEIIEE